MKKKSLSQYETLLIDLDNTLYDHDLCHNFALEKLCKKFITENLVSEEKSFNLLYTVSRQEVKRQLEQSTSKNNRILYIQKMLEASNKFSIRNTLMLEQVYWNSFFEKLNPFSGVTEFLASFKNVNIITNFEHKVQFQKIENLGLQDYVHSITTSEEIGFEKPNINIFEAALSKTPGTKEDVLFIGNDYASDYVGAKKMNIDTLFYNKNQFSCYNEVITFQSYNELNNERNK